MIKGSHITNDLLNVPIEEFLEYIKEARSDMKRIQTTLNQEYQDKMINSFREYFSRDWLNNIEYYDRKI
jgi:hypothetical protein